MANYNLLGVSPVGFIAGGTVTQYRVCKLDSTEGQVVHTTVITDEVAGVAMVSAASGGTVHLQTFGKAKVMASDAISLGAQVMPTHAGGGKVVTAAGATAKSLGIALQASGADGDIIEILLHGGPNINGIANS